MLPGAAVCAAIAVCLFGELGAIGLTGPDEPRYVWIARAMAQTGDWVTPRLYGEPWFEKPILYYWAAAVGFRLNLPTEWAARLPSALAALATALAIGWLARQLHGTRTAGNANWARNPVYVAPLIFSTSVAAVAFARAGTPDMLFSASVTLAMVCAAVLLAGRGAIRARIENASAEARPRELIWLALLGAFLGAGTLAKGPAAVILAGGAVLVWAAATGAWREALRLAHPVAIAAFCVVALPWYAMCAVRNPDFLRVFILQHNFERYLTPMFQHRQPFWFFGPVFLAALLPWTIFLWPVCREGLRLWKEKSWRDSPGFFLACWIIFPIFFFSLSQSKLPSYILPAIAPAALLCAVAGIRALDKGSGIRVMFAFGIAATWIALAAAGFVFIGRIDWQANNPDAISNGAPMGVYAIPIVIALAAVCIAATRGKADWAIGLCAFCLVFGVAAGNIVVIPRMESRYSARPFVQLVQNDAHANRILAYKLPRAWAYGIHFYAGRELPEWSPNDPDPALILTTPQGLAELQKMGRSSGPLGETRGSLPPVMYVPVNSSPR